MSNPRRVALLIIAANFLVAPLAVAQSGSRGNQGRNAPAQDEDEDEDEDEAPPPRRQTPPPRAGTPATAPRTTTQTAPARSTTTSTSTAVSSQPARATADTATPATLGYTDLPAPANDFPEQETEQQAEARREAMLPRFSSIDGSIGLLHMSTAEAGGDQTFRFGLIGEYFGGTGFLRQTGMTGMTPTTPQDNSGHIGATFTLSYSPIRYLEFFTALRSFANYNDTERPQLFQVLGDFQLGAKGIYPITRGVSIGASIAGVGLNNAGAIGLRGNATSMNARLMFMADLHQITGSVPLRIHLNLGYFLDNSAVLVADVESARQRATPGWNAADCMTPSTSPTSAWARNPACHVEISRQERYALGINRADKFNISLGVDAILPAGLRPFVEYNLGIPVVRNQYICWEGMQTGGQLDNDRCLASSGVSTFSAAPSALTIGTRWLPPVRGLSALLAIDIATGGAGGGGLFVRELAPITPWMLYFGASYSHDFAPQIQRVEVVREVVRERRIDASPVRGRLVGAITDAESHQPVSGAIIDFVGHADFGLVASDATGRYQSRQIPPGEYDLHVRATDFNDNTCHGTVPAPTSPDVRELPDVTVDCALRPLPRMGNIAGHVTNSTTNTPVAGVTVSMIPGPGITVAAGQQPPQPATAVTAADGSFSFPNLPAGAYSLSVAQGPQTRAAPARNVDVRPRETANGDIQVAPSDVRGITVGRGGLTVRDQIHFQTDSAEILPDSTTLVERIADVINRHPEIGTLEIQGHTDNQGTPGHNQTLSQNRAEAVRAALVNLGVPADRLTARGYGQMRPIAPNLTAAGRARNRRVMFVHLGRPAARPAPAARPGAARPAPAR